MNDHLLLGGLLPVVIWLGSTLAVVSLKPPKVEKCQPFRYLRTEFDPEAFLAQTLPGRFFFWYRADSEGWWYDWDAERQPLKRIIIHHSATDPKASAKAISDIDRSRLYAPWFNADDVDHLTKDPYCRGLPIHSGHVVKRSGETESLETFIGYHHLVYTNGSVTTELSPVVEVGDVWYVDMVGWHAGKWLINCESIAICLVGDWTTSAPTKEQLEATNGLVAYYRALIPKLAVEPHHQYTATECPGKTWNQWRDYIRGE